MDLEQLLDPARLAGVWNAPRRRAPEWDIATDGDTEPGAEPGAGPATERDRGAAAESATAAALAVAKPPDAQDSFVALRAAIEGLFAEGTKPRSILDNRLAGGDGSLKSLDDLDDVEDLLDAFLTPGSPGAAPGEGQ